MKIDLSVLAPPLSEQLKEHFPSTKIKNFEDLQFALSLLFNQSLIDQKAYNLGIKKLKTKIERSID